MGKKSESNHLDQAQALREIASAIGSLRKIQKQEKAIGLMQKDAEDRRIQANNLLQLGTLLFISIVAENLLTGKVSPLVVIIVGLLIIVIYFAAHKIMKGGGDK